MEKNLITKDRQRKPLDCNRSDREYGDARGLAGIPWAAAEVLEGYFSGPVVSSEKCRV